MYIDSVNIQISMFHLNELRRVINFNAANLSFLKHAFSVFLLVSNVCSVVIQQLFVCGINDKLNN